MHGTAQSLVETILPCEQLCQGAVYDKLNSQLFYIALRLAHALHGLQGLSVKEILHIIQKLFVIQFLDAGQTLRQNLAVASVASEGKVLFAQQISLSNTALAARKIKEEQDRTQAAIASEQAAKIYGLSVLERGVNQSDTNSTRFIIVTNQKIFLRDAAKVSLCLEVSHESGSLYRILSHFIYNNLNMCKIESRPIEERNWEYRFFIDFEGNLADGAVMNALRGLREEARSMKILGNY